MMQSKQVTGRRSFDSLGQMGNQPEIRSTRSEICTGRPESRLSLGFLFALIGFCLACVQPTSLVAQAHYSGSTQIVASGFSAAVAVAVDGSGNIFVDDFGNGDGGGAIKEILAAGGYTTVNTLYGGLDSYGVAVDGSANVFFTNSPGVYEVLAAGGYTTVSPVVSDGFYLTTGVAVDGSGNVFFASVNQGEGNGAVYEALAAGGYSTVKVLLGDRKSVV